jgi:uncharacterized repeat protein (TIGR03803 family)
MKKSILTITLLFLLSLNTKAQLDTLLTFNHKNGATPYGSLISDGTYLYGMTSAGGVNNKGTIFKIKPDGTGFDTLLNFNGINGADPIGSLYSDGTYLYGMTYLGGANNQGILFKIKTDGTGYVDLLDFNGTNGSLAQGSLISDGTYLYGMTPLTTTGNSGNIFKIKTDGTGYVDLFDFNSTTAASPYGSLITDGTYLYGMTNAGGANNSGVIFKIKTDGTGYTDLLNFNIANGNLPYGSLITDGTYLYGMTYYGGINSSGALNDFGTIFKIKTDGTNYTDLFNFNKMNGANPYSDLISDGTYLYGLTSEGGTNNEGTLFKIKTDGTHFVKLADFNTTVGATPSGDLLYDGTYFYGTTSAGGKDSVGTLFKFAPQAEALNFDGVDDYVDLGTNLTTTFNSLNSITVEAWVNPSSPVNNRVIAGNYNTAGTGMQFLLRQEAGNYSFIIDNGSGFQTVYSVSTVTLNVWQHVAGTWDGNNLKIYINGVLDNTTANITGATFANSTSKVWLGGDNISENFKGSMDEMRIWRRALCSAEIQNNMNAELPAASRTGLVAYYKFNQGFANVDNTAISTLADSSGNSLSGTLTNLALTGTTSNFIANGGVATGSLVTVFSNTLSAVATQTNISCHATSDGAASVAVTGAAAPFSYLWSPGGSTTNTITNLATGTYTCIVNNSCAASITQTVNIVPASSVPTVQSPTICVGSQFVVGTHSYTTAGTYNDTLTTSTTCDSLVITHLTVFNVSDVNTSVNGNSYIIFANNSNATSYQWVDCNNGYAPIAGATSQSYTATALFGSYAVIVTQGCAATSACVTIAPVGIAQNKMANSLQVYPNPFSNQLTIVSSAKTTAMLFDMLGNQIKSFNLEAATQTINVGELAPGMYYLQVDAQKIKIMKQ